MQRTTTTIAELKQSYSEQTMNLEKGTVGLPKVAPNITQTAPGEHPKARKHSNICRAAKKQIRLTSPPVKVAKGAPKGPRERFRRRFQLLQDASRELLEANTLKS